MTDRSPEARNQRRVVICGGGVAAIEALLALRAHVRFTADVHLVAPNRQFVYRPLAVAAPFDLAETHLMDLAEIARDQNAKLHVDSLVGVDTENRSVSLASGVELAYGILIIAVGADRRSWLEGAVHFGDSESIAAFREILAQLENGSVHSIAFVNQPDVGWTLPLYELALLTASHLVDQGIIGTELTIVTPETEPLAAFGPTAAKMLRGVLSDRGIMLKVGSSVQRIHDGKLYLQPRAMLEVDRVVTMPQLSGPRLWGVPCDDGGFIPVDEHSRAIGVKDVYAAGDGTDFPVKQGGIAAQQADAAAEAVAAQLGGAVRPAAIEPTLRGILLTGISPVYLRARCAGADASTFQTATNPLWWPPSKIAARHLAPYLAGHSALTADQTLQDRPVAVRDPAELKASHDEARELALVFAERDAADRHYKSALQWLEVIEQLDGMLPPGYMHKRAEWRDAAHRKQP